MLGLTTIRLPLPPRRRRLLRVLLRRQEDSPALVAMVAGLEDGAAEQGAVLYDAIDLAMQMAGSVRVRRANRGPFRDRLEAVRSLVAGQVEEAEGPLRQWLEEARSAAVLASSWQAVVPLPMQSCTYPSRPHRRQCRQSR